MADLESSNNIHFIFAGRMNPPTVSGHLKVVKQMIEKANEIKTLDNNVKLTIYLTRTQDKKSNPLTPKDKLYFLNIMKEKLNELYNKNDLDIIFTINKDCANPFKALKCAANFDKVEESDEIYFFLGKDREDLFEKSKRYFYDEYPDIVVYNNVIERDETSMSASLIREKISNVNSFSLDDENYNFLYNEYVNNNGVQYLSQNELNNLINKVRIGLKLGVVNEEEVVVEERGRKRRREYMDGGKRKNKTKKNKRTNKNKRTRKNKTKKNKITRKNKTKKNNKR